MSFAKAMDRARVAPEAADGPRRMSYLCGARGCCLAGSLSEGGGDSQGFCSYHYGAPPDQWPAITDVIAHDHGALSSEINTARRYFAQMPGRNDSEGERLAEAWRRLQPLGYDLNPANCVVRDGDRYAVTGYRQWANCAERLLGQYVGPLLASTSASGARESVPAGLSVADAIRQCEVTT